MGVIRWEEDADGKWQGHLGWSHVATAGLYTAPDGSDIYALTVREDFPGFKEFVDPYESIDACKEGTEELIQEWLDEAGLVPKADYDNLQQRFDGLTAHNKNVFELLQERVRYAATVSAQAEDTRLKYLGCIDVLDELHIRVSDLTDENAVLKERIRSAFVDIDNAITALKRKVDDIVADTGVDRSYSWDVPVDQWWNGGKCPKKRNAVDLGNIDIIANGYAAFRKGAAA